MAGRQRTYTIGTYPEPWGLADAREEARRLRRLISQGGDPAQERRQARQQAPQAPTAPPPGLTVAEVIEAYLADLGARARPATVRNWGRALRVDVAPRIGHLAPEAVRRADVRALLAAQKPAGAVVAYNALRACWRWAMGQDWPGGREITSSPLLGVAPPQGPPPSDRVLSADELKALFVALDSEPVAWADYRDLIWLLLLTVARREMVAGMRRSELEDLDDDARARWVVPAVRMKAGRVHVVPLSPQALEIIRRRAATVAGECLFPGRAYTARPPDRPLQVRGEVVTAIKAATEAALGRPMERWRLHSLRHTAATHMRETLGVSREVVSLLLAHSPGGPAVTRIYDRSTLLADRRAALEAWGSRLNNISNTA